MNNITITPSPRIIIGESTSGTLLNCALILVYLSLATVFGTTAVLTITQYKTLRSIIQESNRTVRLAGSAVGDFRDAAKEWKQASKQSEAMTQQTLQTVKNLADATARLNITAGSLNALIQHTDDSVNVSLAPQISQAIGENNERLATLVADTDKTILAMGATSSEAAKTMAQATSTLADAGKVIGDPAIPAILAKTNTTAQNVAETTAHLDAASADIQKKVHQMTKPASFFKQVAEDLFTLAAPVISIFK